MSDLQRNTVGSTSTVAPTPPTLPSGAKSSFHLLVIGIDDYVHWDQLKTARAGAEALEELLRVKYGFPMAQVRRLLNRDATKTSILRELRELTKNLRKEDSLLIYFAGHGHIDGVTESGAWVPVDGKTPSDPDASGSWLEHETVRNHLNKCQARHVFLISDSCFAGDFVASPRGGGDEPGENTEYIRKVSSQRSRQVLTSGGLEPVADGGGNGHSIFTKWLLTVLAEFPDQCLAASKLALEVREAVGNNADQVPQFSILSRADGQPGGEFVFFSGGNIPAMPPKVYEVVQPPRRLPWRKFIGWSLALLAGVLIATGAIWWVRWERTREQHRIAERTHLQRDQELRALQGALKQVEDIRNAESLTKVQEVKDRLAPYLNVTSTENRRLVERKLMEASEEVVRRLQEEPLPARPAETVMPNNTPVVIEAGASPVVATQVGPPSNLPRPGFGWTNSIDQQFVPVPGAPVLFAVTETSLRDYARFETNRAKIKRLRQQTEDHPVVHVRWRDATNFAGWLTQRERRLGSLGAGQLYRLPMDAEWSLAAGLTTNPVAQVLHEQRGALSSPRVDSWWRVREPVPPDTNFGGEELESDPVLKLQRHLPTYRDTYVLTAPVNALPPNPLGLFHLPGNVSEWCQDDERDGRHWARGAAWDTGETPHLDKRQRWYKKLGEESAGIGFRLVLVTGE